MYASSDVSRGTFDIAFLICCRPSEDVKRTMAETENMCGEEHLRNKLSFLPRPRHADFYARGYCSLVSSIDCSYQTNLKWPQLRSTRSSLRQCIILSRGGRHRNHELGYGRQMTPTPRKSVWLLLPLVRSTYIGRIRVSTG